MHSPRRLVLPLVALALVAASCGGGLDIGGPAGVGPPGAADGASSGSTLETAWTRPTRGLVSAPVEADGMVVAYTAHQGRLSLVVVDPSTGEIVARRPSCRPGVARPSRVRSASPPVLTTRPRSTASVRGPVGSG